jgi:hypothetical protein
VRFYRRGTERLRELGRLKGEADALEQVSIKKNCGIQFRQG